MSSTTTSSTTTMSPTTTRSDRLAPLVGARIRRIDLPEPDLVALTVALESPDGTRDEAVLLLSFSASLPGLGLASERPKGAPASAFCQLLRKHLEGGVVVTIERDRHDDHAAHTSRPRASQPRARGGQPRPRHGRARARAARAGARALAARALAAADGGLTRGPRGRGPRARDGARGRRSRRRDPRAPRLAVQARQAPRAARARRGEGPRAE